MRCTLGGALLGRRKTGFWVTREAGRIPEAAVIVLNSGKCLWDNRFLIEAMPGSGVTATRPQAAAHCWRARLCPARLPLDRAAGGCDATRSRFLRLNSVS